ncbi:hypothetical protein Tco_0441873 [Tanacetum coccineum]
MKKQMQQCPAPRKKLDSEFNEEENKLEMADTQAEIILSQGLPNTSSTTKSNKHYKASMPRKTLRNRSSLKLLLINPMAYCSPTSAHALPSPQLQVSKISVHQHNNSSVLSSNSKTHATVHDGQIVTEPVQRKALGNVGNTCARGKKALTTTNMFQANHEDAYDSDVDEGPNADVAFMANLSSTSATNNPVNEVHSNDNQILDNVDYQLSQRWHQKKHLTPMPETDIDEQYDPHSYLDEIVCLKNANKVARDMLQRFNMPTQTIPMLSKKPKAATADLHKDLLGMKNMNEKPGHIRPENGFYEKLNALMFVPQQELSREQAYWLPANEIASQGRVTPIDLLLSTTVTKILYEHFKKHIQSANETIFREVKEYEQIFDDLDAEYERVKPTSGASKTVPKRAPRNHSSLPAKSANARRVEAHHRTLNKKNHVDSNLLVKHSVSVSNLNNYWKPPERESGNPIAKTVATKPSLRWKPTGRPETNILLYARWQVPKDLVVQIVSVVSWILNAQDICTVMIRAAYKLVNKFSCICEDLATMNMQQTLAYGQFCDGRLRSCNFDSNSMSHPQLRYGGSTQWFTTTNRYSHPLNDMMSASPVACLQKRASLSTKSWLCNSQFDSSLLRILE